MEVKNIEDGLPALLATPPSATARVYHATYDTLLVRPVSIAKYMKKFKISLQLTAI